MLNWYENPEIHDEDYEEMMDLIAQEQFEEFIRDMEEKG